MKMLEGISMDLTEDNLNKLNEIFPEVFEEGKIDFEKLRLILGDNIDDKEERYEFTWNGKSDAIRIAQTPSTGTLRPDKESSKNWDNTENLYIEGDNLEVLKLLQKSYFGKVKMIYIDPPYNTGRDFVYKDSFRDNITNYKEITSQTTRANVESNGRYHTDWLNMMYPRFKIGRNLLTDDGIMIISIDDNEISNVLKICNEIFGETNVETMIWRKCGDGRDGKMKNTATFRTDHEYLVFCYKKQKKLNKVLEYPEFKNEYSNLDGDPRGNYKAGSISRKEGDSNSSHRNYYSVKSPSGKIFTRQFDVSEEEFKKLDLDNRIYWGKDGEGVPAIKIFLNEKREVTPYSILLNKGTTTDGKKELNELFDNEIFENPKPIELLKTLIQISTSESDLIIDFFSGSSTTAHAVMILNKESCTNRRYIMVQLPELSQEKSEAYKSGYKNICEIGKERLRRAGDRIISENQNKEEIEKLDIGFKVFKLDSSNLKSWDSSIDDLEQNILEMETNLKKDRSKEDLLYEILLKSGVELTAKIEEIKVGYNTLYNIGEGALLACLDDKITQDVIDEIPKHKSKHMDSKVIFKEAGFMSDAAKINAIQNLKQFEIEDVRSV